MLKEPKTLQEAIQYFSDEDNCLDYLVSKRWPRGVVCPTCGSTKVGFLRNQRRWQCATKHPKRQFSIKVGTIFEDSPLGLDKWLPVAWLAVNCKNGVSSWEIHRDIGVTQKTAWFMLHRIRLAMQDELTGGNLGGEVEVDETFIGGKARNMHKDRRDRMMGGKKAGPAAGSKTIVLGMLERRGRLRATVVTDRQKTTMQEHVRANVEPGTQIMSDEHGHNWKMSEYEHSMVDHLTTYVDGNVHTNSIESFWSLFKRTLGGTYVSVEPFHLFRYVDEQAFRFNNRAPMDDNNRFSYLLRKVTGKRLTYTELTGKTLEEGPTAGEPF
jgi:transposase-like protein